MTELILTHAPEGAKGQIGSEVLVHIKAEQDLGAEFEGEMVDSLVARIERALAARIEAKIARARISGRRPGAGVNPLGLLAITMALGIPLTAVAGGIGGLPGIIAVWAALVTLTIYFDRRR
jgi:hypothetical protein